MGFATYSEVLRIPVVRRILLLGLLVRIPLWAANIALTLHVVTHLHRSYADAGLVGFVVAICLAISNPWRGRRLDQLGLRRAVAPSIVVCAVLWSIAPWLPFWPFLVVAGVAELFTVPTFTIVRQVLIAQVPDSQRTTALSIDGITTELSYLVGPVLGVIAATSLPTPVALLLCQLGVVLGATLIWFVNPPLVHELTDLSAGAVPLRQWMGAPAIAILAISAVCVLILTGEDISTVAALRSWHHPSSIGWMLALWGLGSAIGGVVYGALRRRPSAALLLVALAASTAVVALAHGEFWFAVLLFVSGAFCAPTITATVDALSRTVPASVRGEAMGWHGAALTFGSALGAPIIGVALDHGGWAWGFALAGLVGLAIALPGLALQRRGATVAALHDVEEAV